MRCSLHVLMITLLVAVGFAHAAPPEHHVDAPAFEPVTSVLRQTVEKGKAAGASAIVYHEGELAYRAALGHADLEADEAMRTDTLIRIASMTKAVTSVAIMMLQEQGKLAIEDPVSDYVPGFENAQVLHDSGDPAPAENALTIEHLLTHTDGLTYGFFGHDPLSRLYREAGIPDGMKPTEQTLGEAVNRLAEIPLMFEPGSQYAYGLGTDVLGRVVEVASGQPLDAFFREQIFEPLGMRDTFFCVPEDRHDRLAALYTAEGGDGLRRIGDEIVQIGNFRFGPHYPVAEPCTYFSGGAGLVSTLDDYASFLLMLLNQGEREGTRLLETETVAAMTRNQLPSDIEAAPFGYGFGIIGGGQAAAAGSYYWGGIFGTYYWNDPHNGVTAVFMTQAYPFDSGAVRPAFQQAVYKALSDHAVTE